MLEPRVNAPLSLTIYFQPIMERVKIAPKLFTELVSWKLVLNLTGIAPFDIEIVGADKSSAIVGPELVIVVLDEVRKYVCLKNHLLGTIVCVIVFTERLENFKTPRGNSSKLKVDSVNQNVIPICGNKIPRRIYVDESTNDTRLGIRDLDGLVRTDEE